MGLPLKFRLRRCAAPLCTKQTSGTLRHFQLTFLSDLTMPSFSVQHGHHHHDTMVFKDNVDGFLYQKDAKRGDRIYLRCCLPECRGRAVASELNLELRQTKRHHHTRDAYPQDLALRNLLKQRAAEALGSTSNSVLFREVTRQHDQGTAVSFP